jgi:hypothetical protein
MEPDIFKRCLFILPFFPLTYRQTRKRQEHNPFDHSSSPLRRHGMRLGSVAALTGYVGQLVCQFLWISGLWLAQPSPVEAMERYSRFQSSSSSSSSSSRPLGESSESQSDMAASNHPGQFYRDGEHLLTQEFWKGKDLSARLQLLRPVLEELKKCMEDRGYLTKKTEEFTQEDWAGYLGVFEECTSKKHTELFKCFQCAEHSVKELTDIHYDRERFAKIGDLKSITPHGLSGNDVLLLTHQNSNLLAIKKFTNKEGKPHKIEEGLKELLDSLFAHMANPRPSKLKISRIYDAVLCPENSFSLIMEGSNTHDIHHYLATPLASDAVKACAQYLAMFHIGNYQKAKISQTDYMRHKAEAFNKLSDNPLKDGGIELLSRAGEQQPDVQKVTAGNIIQLLTEEEQKRFECLYHKNLHDFEVNCGTIFRSLRVGSQKEPFYFLTKTHGDAHGNNFFYNGKESLRVNGYPLSKDSFYRASIIDFSSIIRTYRGIGDPAEDVGRFMGSLQDWAARPVEPGQPEDPKLKAYETVQSLQEEFLNSYLHIITAKKIIPEENRLQFEEILKANCTFYKLRFYKAIFNSQKSNDTKLKILRSWMKEQEGLSLPAQDLSISHANRPWKQVAKTVIHNRLPNKVEGFIESGAQGSSGSYLNRLWKKFNVYRLETATLSSTVSGMGGIGKTSLALAYAHEALENKGYNLIYWLPSETETSLLKGYQELRHHIKATIRNDGYEGESFLRSHDGEDFLERQSIEENENLDDLAREEDPQDPVIKIVKDIQETKTSSEHKWLLVYDNVPHPSFLKGRVPQQPNIDVLVTSRCTMGWQQKPLSLSVFSPEDAATYLLETIGLTDNGENRRTAARLAETLGWLPLALSHAGRYIKLVGGNIVSGEAIENYIEKFNKPSSGHFEKHSNPFNPIEMTYENLIRKTFKISKEQVSELTRELVVYCAYLEPDSIVEDLFIHGLEGLREQDVKEVFNQLYAFSFLKKNDPTKSNSNISMHRLLQFVIKQEEEKQGNLAKMGELVWVFDKLRETFDQDDELAPLELCNNYIRNLQHINEDLKQVILKSIKSREEKVFFLKRQYADLLENFKRYENFRRVKKDNFRKYNKPLFSKETKESIDAQVIRFLTADGMLEYGQDAIIEALSWIDPPQHQNVAESAKQLITDDMGGYDRASIIEAIGKITEPERQGVAESAKQLVTQDMDGRDRILVIRALSQTKGSEYSEVAESTKQLVTPGMDGRNRASIIRALSKIKGSEYSEVAESVKQLVTPGMDGSNRASIIELLSRINEPYRSRVAESAKQLVTQDMDGRDRILVIKELTRIKGSEVSGVAESAKQLIVPNMDGRNRVSVIYALSRVNEPEHPGVAESVKQLITPDMNGPHQATVIRVLSGMDEPYRSEFMESVKQLLTPDMDGSSRIFVIWALSRIKKSERSEFIKNTKQLITPDMDGRDQILVIRVLTRINGSECSGVAESAKQLITPNMDGSNRAFIIEAIGKIREPERQGVTKSAKQLITQDMDGSNQAAVIEVLSGINGSERPGFIESIKQLVTPDMNGHDRASVIEDLGKIRKLERQRGTKTTQQLVLSQINASRNLRRINATNRPGVTESAKQPITPSMNRGNIGGVLSRGNRTERPDVIERSKQPVRPNMNRGNRASIAPRQINGSQYSGVTQSAKQLITPDMNGSDQATIIRVLSGINEHYRLGFIESAKQLVTPDMDGSSRVFLIRALTQINGSQYSGVTESVKQLITPDMDGRNRAFVIEAIGKIREPERQRVTESAKQLITPDMNGFDRASVIEDLAKIKVSECPGVTERTRQLITEDMGDYEQSSIDKLVETRFVIDLGSSGVQLGGFKINAPQQMIVEEVFNKKERILLQASIQDEMLPPDIQKQAIQAVQGLLSEANIDPSYTPVMGFATAWARFAGNSRDLLEAIQSETGVRIRMIDLEIEGQMGFQATLAALRPLVLDPQSFLYQTDHGRGLLGKIIDDSQGGYMIPETIISWDIGGGSMQFGKQNKEGRVEVIGSTDSSTTFANAVIEEIKGKEPYQNTPNPLSADQKEKCLLLAKKRAKEVVTDPFLGAIRSKDAVVFGIGSMHKSNRDYVNKLLGLNQNNFYEKEDLEKAVEQLVSKDNAEIAQALGIKEADARNRFTSMLLVLGFMDYLGMEKVNTLDVTIMTGALFMKEWR